MRHLLHELDGLPRAVKPGAADPLIEADGYRLYRGMICGPLTVLMVAKVPSGIIIPASFRTSRRRMSSGLRRNFWSAWTRTCQVRPNLLKSLT